ncbi:hypothetical protein [Proteiniclasticum sp.]|uniref:hypothetical protein n=1 Tax=Proteiniclasticum sp. TaxID=2053595 RepID=UPI0028A13A37|nr:hypothetical protein [Proteiniclasticum sp.]
MKYQDKSGRFLVEFMMYMALSVFFMSTSFRLYIGIRTDYKKNLSFLKHTDYAYHTFEVLKVDLYTHAQSFALSGDMLHIRKENYVVGNEIILQQRGSRLVYLYGTTLQELCHDLVKVEMNQIGDILLITLIFPDVTYERGYDIGT